MAYDYSHQRTPYQLGTRGLGPALPGWLLTDQISRDATYALQALEAKAEVLESVNRFGRTPGFKRGVTGLVINAPVTLLSRFQAADLNQYLRTEQGRFAPRGQVYQLIEQAHREMAQKMTEILREEFDAAQRAVHRPKGGGPRDKGGGTVNDVFRKAISSPENRIVTPTSWGVGLPSWYDKSPAKRYWRFIEQGGTNPMTRTKYGDLSGRVYGLFNPGGVQPNGGAFRAQGRLGWKLSSLAAVVTEGRPQNPNIKGFRDFAGYNFHRAANARFESSGLARDIYRRVFAGGGISFGE